jgi:archaellum component FlaC
MATRLYLLQFKYGADDQAAEAEFTVEQQLQLFSAAMQDASHSIQSFHSHVEALSQNVDQLSKTLGGADLQFANTHRETTKAIKDNITTVVEDIRGALKTPVQEYGRAIRAFTANVDQQSQLLTETLQKSSADVSQAVKEACESAQAVIQATGKQIASDHLDLAEQLSGQVRRIVDELRRLSEEMGSIEIPTDGLKRVVDCFVELERALTAVAGMLGPDASLRVNLSHFGHDVQVHTDAVGKALADVTSRLKSIIVPREIVIDISNLTAVVEELRASVEKLLERANDQKWEKAPQAASDAIHKLITSVNNLRETVDSADESVKKTISSPDGRGARSFPRNLWPW